MHSSSDIKVDKIYLKIDELSILPPEGLPLPDDDGGHHLLAELRLPLLDGGQDHVPATGGRQPGIQPLVIKKPSPIF